ncbi:hypothetical protein G7046_g8037 [Stylonectria norvegica]|nr:hypothetical protein G7046_g8037 [Stylonectria norvegica]
MRLLGAINSARKASNSSKFDENVPKMYGHNRETIDEINQSDGAMCGGGATRKLRESSIEITEKPSASCEMRLRGLDVQKYEMRQWAWLVSNVLKRGAGGANSQKPHLHAATTRRIPGPEL